MATQRAFKGKRVGAGGESAKMPTEWFWLFESEEKPVASLADSRMRANWLPQAMSKPCSDGASNGCPTWIRTMTRRVKVACATITPSGSDEWKGHAAALRTTVKAGKKTSFSRRRALLGRTLVNRNSCEVRRNRHQLRRLHRLRYVRLKTRMERPVDVVAARQSG